jgi:MFS family permease
MALVIAEESGDHGMHAEGAMTDPFTANVADTVGDQRAGRRLPRFLQPFRTRAYRRLAVALVLSSFASGVWIVALVWEVIGIGGSESDVSVVATASAAGLLIPALLAGVVADRVPQKLILLGVATLELLGMGLVAALALNGLTQVWHLMAVSFVTGVGMAFYYPAYSAWLPALVPEQDLMAVNGFEGMVRPAIAQAIGPAVAGAAIGAMSPGGAVVIAAVSSGLGILALLTVPLTAVRRDLSVEEAGGRAVARAWGDIREGFAYMVRTPWLLATLLFASGMMLVVMGPLEVLTPFLIKDELGGDASGHASVLAAFGIGGAIGSFVMGSVRMPRRYLTLMNLLWGAACLPFVAYAFATQLWVLVAAGFLLGAAFSAPMVIWGTLLQRRVPPALLGRVASLDFFVSASLMPVSMALAAPVANAIGLRTTFLVAGLIPVVLAVVAIVAARLPADEIAHPLRDEEEPPAGEEPEVTG